MVHGNTPYIIFNTNIMKIATYLCAFLIALLTSCTPAVAQDAPDQTETIEQQDLQLTPLLAFQRPADKADADQAGAELSENDVPGLDPVPEETTFWEDLWAWLRANWVAALLGLIGIIEIIVNLTPTERDNAWFKWLRDFVNTILPNRAKGGGTHARQ